MSLTRLAIEKNRITLITLLIIIGAGVSAYRTMPQSEDPGFIVRTAFVQTILPGASPQRVENLVTDPLEAAIQQMPELDFVTSQSLTGLSIIYVNIKESYKEMRPIWDSLRRKVEGAAADLPEDAIGPIVDDEFGDLEGVVQQGQQRGGATLVGQGALAVLEGEVLAGGTAITEAFGRKHSELRKVGGEVVWLDRPYSTWSAGCLTDSGLDTSSVALSDLVVYPIRYF